MIFSRTLLTGALLSVTKAASPGGLRKRISSPSGTVIGAPTAAFNMPAGRGEDPRTLALVGTEQEDEPSLLERISTNWQGFVHRVATATSCFEPSEQRQRRGRRSSLREAPPSGGFLSDMRDIGNRLATQVCEDCREMARACCEDDNSGRAGASQQSSTFCGGLCTTDHNHSKMNELWTHM